MISPFYYYYNAPPPPLTLAPPSYPTTSSIPLLRPQTPHPLPPRSKKSPLSPPINTLPPHTSRRCRHSPPHPLHPPPAFASLTPAQRRASRARHHPSPFWPLSSLPTGSPDSTRSDSGSPAGGSQRLRLVNINACGLTGNKIAQLVTWLREHHFDGAIVTETKIVDDPEDLDVFLARARFGLGPGSSMLLAQAILVAFSSSLVPTPF